LLVQAALSAVKWKVLLLEQARQVPYRALLRTYLIGNFINLFMPSMLAGDAYRVAWLRRHTRGVSAAVPSVLVDRASGLLALMLLASFGLATAFAPDRLSVIVVAVACAAASAYLLAVHPLRAALARVPGDALFKIPAVLAASLHAVRPSKRFLAVLALSFVFQFNTIVINWIYASALGLSATFGQLLLIVPAVYLVEMVPLSINGIGLREGAFAVLFAQFGLPPEEGVALGLTVSVMRYVIGLVGGALLLTEAVRERRT
jgi:glycosyltransferase 2 family protein